MNTPALNWQPERLAAQLALDWPGIDIRAVHETGSTNADLLGAARQGSSLPCVCVAESQTAGRGRQGRTWVSSPGASLTFSIGLPLRPLHGWGALSLVIGHAAAQVLQPWPVDGDPPGQGRLLLKWPNDLWWYDRPPTTPEQRAAGRKLGGILIETAPLPGQAGADGRRWVVIGLGINVRPAALPATASMDSGVAGTEAFRPQDDAPALWHALVPALLQAVRRFELRGFGPTSAAVAQRELLLGQPVRMSVGPVSEGVCIGLDDDGALRVQSASGVHRVVAGEVSVRPAVQLAASSAQPNRQDPST